MNEWKIPRRTRCICKVLIAITLLSTLLQPPSSATVPPQVFHQAPPQVLPPGFFSHFKLPKLVGGGQLANSTPGLSFSEVGAFTSDPKVTNNTGINSTITLPANYSIPNKGCYQLNKSVNEKICATIGVEEPFNKTASMFIGAALLVGILPGVFAYAILPNMSYIISQNNILNLGESYDFSIVHLTGNWWSFAYGGKPVGSGNGTFNLKAPMALGYFVNATTTEFPMQYVAEVNATFYINTITASPAIGIKASGNTTTSYRPVSGNALAANLSSPMGIQGHVQVSTLATDAVQEAGSIGFPGQAAALWGNAKPLGSTTPQAIVYATEPSLAGNTGIGFNLTVPGTFNVTLTAGEAEYLGVQMPLNSTVEIGVGIVEFLSGSALTAAPYYFVRTLFNETIYYSVARTGLGTSVTMQAFAQGNGWWNFTLNGKAILNKTGNGTASLGIKSAAAFTGTVVPSTTLFTASSMPLFGLFGNGTINSAMSPSALNFRIPGKGWALSDFSDGWYWGTSVGIEGQQQIYPQPPRGEVFFGNVKSPLSTEGGLVWDGLLWVNVTISPPSPLYSGQNTTFTATVTSVIGLSPPSSLRVTGKSGTPPVSVITFALSSSGTDWATFTGSYTAPALNTTSWLNLTVNITAVATGYAGVSALTQLTVRPAMMVLKAYATPQALSAGNQSVVYLWVNGTSGPISGATINATVSPSSGASHTPPKLVAPGEYSLQFTPSALLSVKTNYTITFYVNHSGYLNGVARTAVSVTPLPLLSVSVLVKAPASGIVSGGSLEIIVTVVSGSVPIGGATVALTATPPSTWAFPLGVTYANGTYPILTTAPTVNQTTTFYISATASLSGYRAGTGAKNLTVTQKASPSSNGLPTVYLYALIGAAIAAGVIVAVFLIAKKRKATQTGQAESQGGTSQYVQQDPSGSPSPWDEGAGSDGSGPRA